MNYLLNSFYDKYVFAGRRMLIVFYYETPNTKDSLHRIGFSTQCKLEAGPRLLMPRVAKSMQGATGRRCSVSLRDIVIPFSVTQSGNAACYKSGVTRANAALGVAGWKRRTESGDYIVDRHPLVINDRAENRAKLVYFLCPHSRPVMIVSSRLSSSGF